MTEFKIVSTIKNYVTSQRGVTGSPLRNEQIADEVDTLRMRLIAELDASGKLLKPFQGFIQKIEFTINSTKKILLPNLYILDNGKPAIDYIGGKLGKTPYRIIYGSSHAAWIDKDEDINSMSTVQVEGNELTLINSDTTELLLIGIFEDPSSLEDYGYNDETTEYPIPGKMIDVIIGKTAESYLRQMYRIPPQPNNQVDAPQTNRK